MGIAGNFVQAAVMLAIGYAGIALLWVQGVEFSGAAFSLPGLIVISCLALSYSFYFRL